MTEMRRLISLVEGWEHYTEIGHKKGHSTVYYMLPGGRLLTHEFNRKADNHDLSADGPEAKAIAVGRIDDKQRKISVRTPLAPGNSFYMIPQAKLNFITRKLTKLYPGYEVWYFGNGAHDIRRIDAEALTEKRYPRIPSADILSSAESNGFDVSKLYYHGTRKRFDGFALPKKPGIDELGPGVYATSEKWLANTWAQKGGFILTVVPRKGPMFDFETLDLKSKPTMGVLFKGYAAAVQDRWPDSKEKVDRKLFDYVWQGCQDRTGLTNLCLSAAGYVGGFKRHSQIEGQIVVFKVEDMMILAREPGQEYMSWNAS